MTELISKKYVLQSMELIADGKTQWVQWDIGGTNNRAIIRLEKVYRPDAQFYLTTGSVARDDEHLVRHFLHHTADMEEMSAWLRDTGNADRIIDSLTQLSNRVDEGFD